MSIREHIPGDRGNGATHDVASILAAIAHVSIEPFGSDNPELAGLPKMPDNYFLDPLPASQLTVARAAYDSSMEGLGQIKQIEAAVAALKARLVARAVGAAAIEAKILSLDSWQNGVAASSTAAEMALTLCITESAASELEYHSQSLVADHPDVMEALEAGKLSWRHATVIHDEIQTLKETRTTTSEDAAMLEARLLVLAENTTGPCFTRKARRAREKMHPETMTTRTKEAFRNRNIDCEPGKDGMSWLTLYLPTVSASAIYTRCTRLARAVKAEANRTQQAADASGSGQDCRETRTLSQLRVDIAAILLLGQDLPAAASAGGASATASETKPGAGTSFKAGGNSVPPGEWPGSPNGQASAQPSGTYQDGCVNNGPAQECATAFGVTVVEQYDTPPWELDRSSSRTGPANHQKDASKTQQGPSTTAEDGFASGDVLLEGTILPSSGTQPSPNGSPGAAGTGDCGGGPDGDSPLEGQLVGDGSGLVGDIVDGIPEHPSAEYLQQLDDLAHSKTLTDPPMPEILAIVTVPLLSLLGITGEPAELVGPQGGPMSVELAQKLLGNASTFLRVMTDPLTGETLPLEPQRYTLRAAEKAVLQAMAGGCYVPNCTNQVMDIDVDHLRAFEFGGASTLANLRGACRKHHAMKHLKDDKDRHGKRRAIDEPDRQGISIRGWTPKITENGGVAWITPSGRLQPPAASDPNPPHYPKWLKKLIQKSLTVSRGPAQGSSDENSRHSDS